MLTEIGEWRLRHENFFISITFTANHRPCLLMTNVLRGEVAEEVRREITEELYALVLALADDLRQRLEAR